LFAVLPRIKSIQAKSMKVVALLDIQGNIHALEVTWTTKRDSDLVNVAGEELEIQAAECIFGDYTK
jgi:hypothetical protein